MIKLYSFFIIFGFTCYASAQTSFDLLDSTYAGYGGGFYKSVEVSDGYVSVGYTTSPTSANYSDALLIKTDKKGNPMYRRDWIFPMASTINDALALDDGSVILTGGLFTLSGDNTYTFVMRVDINGDIVWAKQYDYSSNSSGGNIFLDASNNIVIFGTQGFQLVNAFVLNLDHDGNTVKSYIISDTVANGIQIMAFDMVLFRFDD